MRTFGQQTTPHFKMDRNSTKPNLSIQIYYLIATPYYVEKIVWDDEPIPKLLEKIRSFARAETTSLVYKFSSSKEVGFYARQDRKRFQVHYKQLLIYLTIHWQSSSVGNKQVTFCPLVPSDFVEDTEAGVKMTGSNQ